MKLALVTLVLFVAARSFKIPLIFGGISIDRTPGNEIAVGVQRGVNVLGNGYDRNTKFTVGNGSFATSDANSVLVNGRRSGTSGSLGAGKDGFNIGSGLSIYEKPKRSVRGDRIL